MTPLNYELFEFNKMLLVYFLTIIITSAWLIKSAISGKFYIRRTPLDIPIVLFVLSQVLSVLFSIDPHISIFGYYGRFNGGLLSTISYIILYYAFVSNISLARLGLACVKISLLSGFLVSLYALLQKLGIDKNIWVQDVQARPFSTLGQPNWLAAYLAILLPIAMAFSLSKEKSTNKKTILRNYARTILRKKIKNIAISKYLNIEPLYFRSAFYIGLSLLFYSVLLLTKSRSGFLAFWLANGVFWLLLHKSHKSHKSHESHLLRFLLVFNFSFLLITFIIGSPFPQLNRFFSPTSLTSPSQPSQPLGPALETGGTESGEIRKIVWKGALEAFKARPLFGWGVETFAWIYYKFKPVEHNLTSEWDFLYNKAHNEYLNYAATTGLGGLGSYLLIIFTFVVSSIVSLFHCFIVTKKTMGQWGNGAMRLGLFSAWLSILISNFFGFSVVPVALYFWLIPAITFTLSPSKSPNLTARADYLGCFFSKIKSLITSRREMPRVPQKGVLIASFIKQFKLLKCFGSWRSRSEPRVKRNSQPVKQGERPLFAGTEAVQQAAGVILLLLLTIYLLLSIAKLWLSDYHFAQAHSLNRAGDYQQAYQEIKKAINLNPGEPLYHDELSIISTSLAVALYPHNPQNPQIPQLINQAIDASDFATTSSPHNLNFLKTRTRMFYTLSQLDPAYLNQALQSILMAQQLASTDAKISYNLALIFEANGQREKAIETLKETLKLKPNYQDAQEALELFLNP